MESLSVKPQIFVNGKPQTRSQWDGLVPCFRPEEQISVFESVRSYGGTIFRLDRHLTRLFESAKTAGLELPKSRSELKQEIKSCLAHWQRSSRRRREGQDCFIRLTVDAKDSYIFLLNRKRPPSIYKTGLSLKTVVTRRNLVSALPPEAKSSAFFNCVLAAMELEAGPLAETVEAVFLDSNGYLTEAASWNLFMVKDGKVLTPETGFLNGVTREFVIECARKERLPVSETTLTRHDFWNADEAFVTNTSGEIAPVRSLDGRRIGKDIPGLITEQLMSRFHQELEKELKSDED